MRFPFICKIPLGMINRWITELLAFSHKERSGIIGLLLIIIILIFGGKLISFFYPQENYDFSKWDDEISLYLKNQESTSTHRKLLTPFPFNPNTIDSMSLVQIGLPDKVIANLLRYRERGGYFRDKKGVQKIFGMTSEYFNQIDSFLLFTAGAVRSNNVSLSNDQNKFSTTFKQESPSHTSVKKRENSDPSPVELNSADSIALVQIRGIGPVLASRIIRYRNILGGYYAVSQIKEVYGLRDENFLTVSKYLVVNPSLIKTFNLNFSTLDQLGHHPYIGYRSGRKMLRLRDTRGRFGSADDLSPVLNSDSLRRRAPYLRFSQ